MRLIDADALLSKCKLAQKQASYNRQYANAFYSASGDISTEWWCVEDIIEDAPTIEPERKKGKWIKVMEGNAYRDKCNQCGRLYPNAYGYNLCPNCGADMREGEEE